MKLTLKQTLPYLYLAAGVIGIVISFALTYDKIQILKDPTYHAPCSLNPVLSCGSVMKTQQASLLGVPNTIFGLMAFTALTTVGVVLLSGAQLRRRFWLLINAGALGGFGFFAYLFFQAVYRIHAICPYCFVIWLIVPPVLWYTTLYNLRERHLRVRWLGQRSKDWVLRHHGDVLICWYLVFFGILLYRFWYYWQTLI